MQRRRRKNSVVRSIFFVLLIVSILYILRAAIAEQLDAGYSNQTLVQVVFGYHFPHLLWKHTFTVALVVWTFAFGASIGSFLNVVVYRMPRGESLNKRGSHCPYCNQPIRLRDNLPVFGWLNLRGRCYVCRLPISIRYPIVEFITGATFVVFFLYEVANGGEFLPRFEAISSRDGMIGIFSRDLENFKILLGMFAFHMLAVIVLWSAMLIERDRNEVPILLVIVPTTISVCVASIWPGLIPVEWYAYSRLESLSDQSLMIARHFSSVIGLAVGAGQGFAIESLVNRSAASQHVQKRPFNKSRVVFTLASGLVGATFGWQAILLISLPLVVLLYFVRVWQQGQKSKTGFDRFGLLVILVVVHWIIWKATHGGFETGISGAPFLLYGLIALGFAAAFCYPPLPNAYNPSGKNDPAG